MRTQSQQQQTMLLGKHNNNNSRTTTNNNNNEQQPHYLKLRWGIFCSVPQILVLLFSSLIFSSISAKLFQELFFSSSLRFLLSLLKSCCCCCCCCDDHWIALLVHFSMKLNLRLLLHPSSNKNWDSAKVGYCVNPFE